MADKKNVHAFVDTAEVPGEEVDEIMEAIEPILMKYNPVTSMVACLSMAIYIQCPFMNEADAIEGVLESSRFIAMWLQDKNPEGLVPNGGIN